ncbi:MAG: sulfite exporter TauE/SafE family protein [Gemmatimonadales bacterium]|nr:sulfite exporter TauE/SafE family protein [Gemmatimonadales bacterium]
MTLLGGVLAGLIGVVLGILGAGGAILTVPVLVYVLGYSIKAAVPMSLLIVGVASAVGLVAYQRGRAVSWDAVAAFAPSAMVGAFGGGVAAAFVSSRMQLVVFGALLLSASVAMLAWPAPSAVETELVGPRRSWWLIAVLGAAVGFLTGLVGVGGGFLYVPVLTLMGGLAMRRAVGTSLALIVVSCTVGLLTHLRHAALDLGAASLFMVPMALGALIGTRLAPSMSQVTLRRAFAGVLVVIGVTVLFTAGR